MESLGEMLKAWPGGKSMTDQAEQKLGELMADPLVERLFVKHPELNERAVRMNMNRVYQYVNEYRNCSNCPGLNNCPNDFEGHYTLLSCETVSDQVQLIDRKVSCKKFLARRSEEQIKNRIRSFYVDETALNNGYSADEILFNDPKRTEAAYQILAYIDKTKEEGLQKEGLYLAGKFGTGKTFLMCYLLHELAKAGYSGAIVYMPEFVEDLKSMMHDQAKLRETVEMMKETDLLIFDDMGAENLNPWVRDHVLGSILNYRMNRKPTLYTSNYELDALERHFSFTSKDGDEQYKGERLMNRIRPYVEVVMVTGENKRGRK